MQGNLFWVRNVLRIGHVLIVRFTGVGLAEIGDAFFLGGRNDHILVSMGFLLATVKKCLFFRVFWSLAASFRAIDDRIERIGSMVLFGFELLRVSFWHHAQIIQGLFQDGQQPMDPLVRSTLLHAKQFTQHRLKWVAFLVDQSE